MVVERELILAMDMGFSCAERGYDIAGPFPSCKETFHWLAANTPDLAIIGTQALDGSCAPLADELRQRKGPAIIHTADEITVLETSEFQYMTLLLKPFRRDQLAEAIDSALDSSK
jgi:hypothetical protein